MLLRQGYGATSYADNTDQIKFNQETRKAGKAERL